MYLIPNAHDDPGWIETFEEFQEVFDDQINSIINITQSGFPTMKFTLSDIIFLPAYDQKYPGMMDKLRQLVKSKNIEIVN
jgi:hypothetical protein